MYIIVVDDMGKRKLILRLYRNKNVAKQKRDNANKRKADDGQNEVPCKLSRISISHSKTPGRDGDSSIHSVGVIVEGSEISNAVPPSISSTDMNECESLKDKANRILADKCTISMLVDNLFESGMLVHYIAHFQELATGMLSPKNVAVLFGLQSFSHK